MPRPRGTGGRPTKRPIEQYEHKDKQRMNNPPVGLVTAETDPPLHTHKTYDYVMPVPSVPGVERTPLSAPGPTEPALSLSKGVSAPHKTKYDYDPHLDPQLVWAGKKEHTSFDVHTVSLHVHERIDPSTIVEAVRKRNGNGHPEQPSLFERREENPPFRDAVDFYKHPHGWSNRLIAGDSLLVMNSLLEKEGMAGQVQMVYIDPPYGKTYNSNFQPFINKREVKDGKDEDLTQEPEMIRAFRDTWELDIHSYLTYLRDRLLLARELLHASGSCFVQIGDENIHRVRQLMDEVFSAENFAALITFKKTLPLGASGVPSIADYLLWYTRSKDSVKFRSLYESKPLGSGTGYTWLELEDGTRRKMSKDERELSSFPKNSRVFFSDNLLSSGYTPSCFYDFGFEGRAFKAQKYSWKTNEEGMKRLIHARRIIAPGALPTYVRFFDDFPVQVLHNLWNDTHGATDPTYVVQTSNKVLERCLLMTTDPGEPSCSIPPAARARRPMSPSKWGRRWITCDTSRVAVTLAKQRLMTADFDYYELLHPEEGVGSGFRYKTRSARHAEVPSPTIPRFAKA